MPEKTTSGDAPQIIRTGIPGLDDILEGGLAPNRLYLMEGDPGSGKTTLGLRFLLEGRDNGEPVLYVTLSETRDELLAVAQSHGWSLDGISITELAPAEEALGLDEENTIFHPSEIELSETTKIVLAEVEKIKPRRVVFDSLSEMRLLAQNALRYRRQILALKQFFIGRECTVLLLDDRTSDVADLQLQSLAHGVLTLERRSPEYGVMQRRLQVAKMRGRRFRAGFHDYNIERGGLQVFPRLIAAEHAADYQHELVTSGVEGLDALLKGGLDRGTSALFVGPAGSGKSTFAAQYVAAAAARGESASMFLFDESERTLLARSTGLGIGLAEELASGRVRIRQVDPGSISIGELVHLIREEVARGVRVIAIDSLNGYLNAVPEARYLNLQLHELLTYLGQCGVTTILVLAQHGMVGRDMQSEVDVSYLADTVMLLRYFEAGGRVRQALSVVKKRSGPHEKTIREFQFGAEGISIGEPLEQFHGVLTGVPTYVGEAGALLETRRR